MLALWGDAGIAASRATPLDTWNNWASDCTAHRSIPGISCRGKSASDGGAVKVFCGVRMEARREEHPARGEMLADDRLREDLSVLAGGPGSFAATNTEPRGLSKTRASIFAP